MKRFLILAIAVFASSTIAQTLKSNIPYVENGHARHVLDIYAPPNAMDAPVLFWIHGGGWQAGDKTSVQVKPKWFTDKGFVFVSTNYRLLPEVDMGTLIRDVAKAFGWVEKHIAEYGGDSGRVLVAGHSAGAQLAAILCTDERYLKEQGAGLEVLIGCVPVDGDTYDWAVLRAVDCARHGHFLLLIIH